MGKIQATGKRKSSIAQVIMMRNKENKGSIYIHHVTKAENFKTPLRDFFPSDIFVQMIEKPLLVTKNLNKYDIRIKVNGGGFAGQAGACSLGISCALAKVSEKNRLVLRDQGFLTRDSRIKERKKYGLKKARKAPQFSKR